MTIEQTIEIPADRRLVLDLPEDIPAGTAKMTLSISPQVKPVTMSRQAAFDPRLEGAVDPAMYGKGAVTGDIIGPFYDAWEQGR
jgi:hypothetical protein